MGPLQGLLQGTAKKRCDLVCMQEHRLSDTQLHRQEQWARNHGWSCSLDGANPTEAGSTSGGVGIATRSCRGLGLLEGMLNPRVFPGRVALWHWGAVIKGGIVVASVWLIPSEGMSPANRAILAELGRLLRRWGRPFLVAGDWNLLPGVLLEAQWPQRLGAVARAPTNVQGTCKGPISWSMLDYFVLSAELNERVLNVEALTEETTYPHVPVVMELRHGGTLPMILGRKLPKPFPPVPPVGPCLEGPDWNGLLRLEGEVCSQGQLDAWAAQVITLLEEELCIRFHIPPAERASHMGRGRPAAFRWGQPSCKDCGCGPKTSAAAARLRWLGSRLDEYRHLRKSGGPGARDRLPGVLASVRRCRGLEQPWQGRIGRLGQASDWDLVLWAVEARQLGLKEDKRYLQQRNDGWRAWCQSAFLGGAGAAHAFSKGPKGWVADFLTDAAQGCKAPAGAQARADGMMQLWLAGPWRHPAPHRRASGGRRWRRRPGRTCRRSGRWPAASRPGPLLGQRGCTPAHWPASRRAPCRRWRGWSTSWRRWAASRPAWPCSAWSCWASPMGATGP